jgi:hypothetical protein
LTLSGRDEYSDEEGQKGKEESLEKSKGLVSLAKARLKQTGLFSSIEYYEPEASSRISGAPAVLVKINGESKLVIAPDLRCKLTSGDVMWVEVKDKPQRYKFPDTGSDAHQHVGFWSVHKYSQEPVLMMFKDNPLPSSQPESLSETQWKDFKSRWRRFAPNDTPEFYGNWLDVLTTYDSARKYPSCRAEHSRNMEMNIIYMDVCKMRPVPDVQSLKALVSEYSGHRQAPDFRVWYQGREETNPESILSV